MTDSLADNSVPANAVIGDGTIVEPKVIVGFRYRAACEPARIGRNGLLRVGCLIYGDVVAGDHFQAGHNTIIRAHSRFGDYCIVNNNTVIEGLAEFGDGVRLMSNVYVPTRSRIGSHVFIGPNVTLLNDKYPCRGDSPDSQIGPTIEDDVVIGGGATVLPGVVIGEGSFIAAGAVVTKNVSPRSLVPGGGRPSEPLPDHLVGPNDRKVTLNPHSLWHPL
jgi:acetyltransferase-like isoleucine patch superfamily enzyme